MARNPIDCDSSRKVPISGEHSCYSARHAPALPPDGPLPQPSRPLLREPLQHRTGSLRRPAAAELGRPQDRAGRRALAVDGVGMHLGPVRAAGSRVGLAGSRGRTPAPGGLAECGGRPGPGRSRPGVRRHGFRPAGQRGLPDGRSHPPHRDEPLSDLLSRFPPVSGRGVAQGHRVRRRRVGHPGRNLAHRCRRRPLRDRLRRGGRAPGRFRLVLRKDPDPRVAWNLCPTVPSATRQR